MSAEKWKLLSCVRLFATPWTIQSMEFSRPPRELYSPWNSSGQNARVSGFPFSRGSSQPRDQTRVSYIAGGLVTSLATREAQEYWSV